MRSSRHVQRIYGYHLPRQRPTLWALGYILMYFAAPFLGVLLVLDGVLYLIFKYVFHTCYGILCLF
ncbi:MAG: hypothetical protein GC134_08465 [Proteobacteria bacterium]|nr:hypothetical protein [Pseudomonadota bacterium]